MIGYEFNDGGRSAAGYKGTAGDCVTRALSILISGGEGATYKDVYSEFSKRNKVFNGKRSARDGVSPKVWESVYKLHGLARIALPKSQKLTYTEAYSIYGDCIVRTTKHVSAIIDGRLQDIFDGRTYLFVSEYGDVIARERKAMSVWKVRG